MNHRLVRGVAGLLTVQMLLFSAFGGLSRASADSSNQKPNVSVADQAVHLVGTSSYVEAQNVSMPETFAAEVWAKSDSEVWQAGGTLISARGPNGFVLSPRQGTQYIDVYLEDSNGSMGNMDKLVASVEVQDITKWHHYAVSFNYTLQVYVDGVKASDTAPSGMTRYNYPQGVGVTFGKDLSDQFGNITLDEVRIWQSARSAEQMARHKDHRLLPEERADLALYLDFNSPVEETPVQIPNLSGGSPAYAELKGGGHTFETEGSPMNAFKVVKDIPVMLPALHITDTDNVAGSEQDLYTVKLGVGDGKLEITPNADVKFEDGSNGSPSMVLSGQMANLNKTLASLIYTPDSGFLGEDNLHMEVADGGIPDNSTSAVGIFDYPIHVIKVNEAPSLVKGTDLSVEEGTPPVVQEGWASNITPGPSEDNQQLTVTLTADHPELFIQQPELDLATGRLTFQPGKEVRGTSNVSIVLKDSGGTEIGGVDTAIYTFRITVNQSNGAPVIIDEHPALHLNGWDNGIKVHDLNVMKPEFTAELWARSSTPEWNENGFLMSARQASGFILHPNKDARSVSIYIMDTSGGIEAEIVDAFKPDDITQWHHYAISYSYDKDASKATIKYYLDGKYIHTFTKNNVQSGRGTVAGLPIPLSIGQDDDSGNSNLAGRNGLVDVDEVRYWDKALTDEEITGNYKRKLTGQEQGLQLYLDMSEIEGGLIPDRSQANHQVNLAGNYNPAAGPELAGEVAVERNVLEDSRGYVPLGVIGDPDAWDNPLTVKLSVEHGSIEFLQTGGLSLLSGANASSGLEYSGSATDLNGALKNSVYKPNVNDNGTDTIKMTVTDSGNSGQGTVKSVSREFNVSVKAVNDAPSFTKGEDQEVEAGASAQTVSGWATNISAGPVDEAGQQLTFELSSDRPELFEAAPAIVDGNLSYTPKADVSGTAVVTVRLKDDGGTADGGVDTSEVQMFKIVIASPGTGPVNPKVDASVLDGVVKIAQDGAGVDPQDAGLSMSIGSGGILKDTLEKNDVELLGLPAGLDYEVSKTQDGSGIAIVITGTASEPVTADMKLTIVVKSSAMANPGDWTDAQAVTANLKAYVPVDVPEEPKGPVLHVEHSSIHEAEANNGSITEVQEVTLENGTFRENVGGVVIDQLPAGLGIHVVRVDDTHLKISFTGKAEQHAAEDSLDDVVIRIDQSSIEYINEEGGSEDPFESDGFAIEFVDPAGGNPGGGTNPGTDPGTGNPGGGNGGGTNPGTGNPGGGNGGGSNPGTGIPGGGTNPGQPPVTPPVSPPVVTTPNPAPGKPAEGSGGTTSGTFKVSPKERTEWTLKDLLKVTIPAGAVQSEGTISAEVVADGQIPGTIGMQALSQGFEIKGSWGHLFGKPVTLTFHYNKPAGIGQIATVYYYNELQKRWIYIGGTANPDGTITVQVNHLNKFAVFAYQPTAFPDLENHWALPYTGRLIGMNVVKGYEDKQFHPEQQVTRAEMTKMLAQLLGLTQQEGSTSFADEQDIPAWAKSAVAAAVKMGLIHGYGTSTGAAVFKGSQSVSRAEMAVIIAGVLRVYGEGTVADSAKANFADLAQIPGWAKASVDSAESAGILKGYEDGRFRPNQAVTRAEAAAILSRLLEALHI